MRTTTSLSTYPTCAKARRTISGNSRLRSPVPQNAVVRNDYRTAPAARLNGGEPHRDRTNGFDPLTGLHVSEVVRQIGILPVDDATVRWINDDVVCTIDRQTVQNVAIAQFGRQRVPPRRKVEETNVKLVPRSYLARRTHTRPTEGTNRHGPAHT